MKSRKGMTYKEIYGPARAELIRNKLSSILAGRVMYIPSIETKNKISLANTGKKHNRMTLEVRTKISKSLLGRKLSAQHVDKLRHTTKVGFIGKNHSLITRKKISNSLIENKSINFTSKSSKSFQWKLRELFEYKEWRKSIFVRDNFTCTKCKIKGCNLEAHHVIPLKELISKFIFECNHFSIIYNTEMLLRIASKWKPFWEINNGKTLCKTCHNFITYNVINRMRNNK